MSEGNINPNVLNRRSLEINRATRPFEISCKFKKLRRISYSSDTKYQVEYFLPLLINLLYFIGNRNVVAKSNRRRRIEERHTCGYGFNCIWEKFRFRIHQNPLFPIPSNPINPNPLNPFNLNPLNPNPLNSGHTLHNSNVGVELDEIVLEWSTSLLN